MKNMKRLTVILALLLAAVLLTACGNSGAKETPAATQPAAANTSAPTAEPTAKETENPGKETGAGTLQSRVETVVQDAAGLASYTKEDLEDMTGIEPADCSEFVFLQGNGMDGREVLAVLAADDAAAERVFTQMESYLERRKEEHRDYAPDAYKLLSGAAVERRGLLLAVVSGKDAAAETAALLAGE